MRPEISELVRRTVYPGLENAESTGMYPNVAGMCQFLYFWDHRVPEDSFKTAQRTTAMSSGSDKSKSNTHEIDCVLGLVTYLLQQGYGTDDITILTGYTGQSTKMANRFKQRGCSLFMSERDIEELQKQGNLNIPSKEPFPVEKTEEPPIKGADQKESEYLQNGEKKEVVELNANAVRIATIDNFQGIHSKNFSYQGIFRSFSTK